jgi:phosphatidylinositol kinase/protein kinase (PI-3  family)
LLNNLYSALFSLKHALQKCREVHNDYFNLVEARLENLETKIDKMADIDQVKAMIEGSKLDTASGGEGTTD